MHFNVIQRRKRQWHQLFDTFVFPLYMPDLVSLYDAQPGNSLGLILQLQGPDGARLFRKCPYTLYNPSVVSGTLSALPSVLWCCCLISRKGIQHVKNYVVGCWHGYLSGARCRLAYVPALPLPLIVSCFSKIQIGFTFLVLAHPGNPRNRALNGCVMASGNTCCRPMDLRAYFSGAAAYYATVDELQCCVEYSLSDVCT